MGIKQLNKLWNTIHPTSIVKIHLQTICNKSIAIDFNLYLYRFLLSKNHYLICLFNHILKFLSFQITPVYIFDGKKPIEKKELLNERKNKKRKLKLKVTNLENLMTSLKEYKENKNIQEKEFTIILNLIQRDIEKYEKNIVYIREDYIELSKKLLELLKIPFIQADNEAEQLCSQLVHNKVIDYCLSDDMDVFPCGASYVLRNFKFNSNYIYKYDLQKFLNYLQINSFQFIVVCILLGCDYIKITIKKYYKNNLNLIEFIKENIITKDDLTNLSNISKTIIDYKKLSNIISIFENSYQQIDFETQFLTLKHHYNDELFSDILNTFLKNQNITLNLHSKIKSFLQYIKKINKNKSKQIQYINRLFDTSS